MNRKFWHLLSLGTSIALALTSVSCVKEQIVDVGRPAPEAGSIPISVSVAQDAPGTIINGVPTNTKSDYIQSSDESTVNTFTVAAYRTTSGTLVDFASATNSTVTLNLSKGGTYNLYAVANMSGLSFPQTESGLSSLAWSFSDFASMSSNGIPMSGEEAGFVATEGGSANVAVARLFAKLNVSIDRSNLGSASLTVNTATVNQVNSSLRPFSNSVATPASIIASGDFDTVGDGSEFTVYVPENMQGSVAGINSAHDKVPANMGSTAGLCTYIEIGCNFIYDGFSGDVDYRFFLGSNPTSNFDVEGNKIYNVTFAPVSGSLSVDGWWKVNKSGVTDNRELHIYDESGAPLSTASVTVMNGHPATGSFYVYYYDGQTTPDGSIHWRVTPSTGLTVTDAGTATVDGKTVRKYDYSVSAEGTYTATVSTTDGALSEDLTITATESNKVLEFRDVAPSTGVILDGAAFTGSFDVYYFDGSAVNTGAYNTDWTLSVPSDVTITSSVVAGDVRTFNFSISKAGSYTITAQTADGDVTSSITLTATAKNRSLEFLNAPTSVDLVDGAAATGSFDVKYFNGDEYSPQSFGTDWTIVTAPMSGISITPSSVSGDAKSFTFSITTAGTYTITAQTADGKIKQSITITAGEFNQTLTVTPSSQTKNIYVGGTATGSFTVSYKVNGSTASGWTGTGDSVFSESGNTVSYSVTGAEVGTTPYTYTVRTPDGTKTATFTLTVVVSEEPEDVYEISASNIEVTIHGGRAASGSTTVTSRLNDEDYSEWTIKSGSFNPTKSGYTLSVSVPGSTDEGSYPITLTAGDVEETIYVVVTREDEYSLTLSPTSASKTVTVGETATGSFTVDYRINRVTSGAWGGSGDRVFTRSGNTVTYSVPTSAAAQESFTYEVTATGCRVQTFTLTVTAEEPKQSVYVSPRTNQTLNIEAGETATTSFDVTYYEGDDDRTSSCEWDFSGDSEFSVNKTTGAVSFSATAAGTYSFTVTTPDGTDSETRTVTVNVSVPDDVWEISISPNLTLETGETGTATVTCKKNGAPVTNPNYWTVSCDSGITATKSGSGVSVTAGSTAGSFDVTVTCTEDETVSDHITVTVKEPTIIQHISVSPSTVQELTINYGETATTSFDVTYTENNANRTSSGAWDFSGNSEFSVNKTTGVVSFSATTAGTYNFTVTTPDGTESDSGTVKVTVIDVQTISVSPSSASEEIFTDGRATGSFTVDCRINGVPTSNWTGTGDNVFTRNGDTVSYDVSGLSVGNHSFNYTTTAPDGKESATFTLTVEVKEKEDNRTISISGDTNLVSHDGATVMGSFSVTYFDGTRYNPSAYGSEWTIQCSRINIYSHSVSGNSMNFTYGTTDGTYTITARTLDGKHSDSITVNVALDPRSIYVNSLSQETLIRPNLIGGETIRFSVEYYDGTEYRTNGWNVSISNGSITGSEVFEDDEERWVEYTAVITGYGSHTVTATTTASENSEFGAISNYVTFTIKRQ